MLCSIQKIAIFCFSFLIFFPIVAVAKCEVEGSTVVFVNGVNTTLRKAQNDLAELTNEYRDRTNDRSVDFLTGYNPSHLEGAGDILKSWFQNQKSSGSYVDDYDLKTILLNLHNDLHTRRVLLLGHSQGSYYTNAMYNYLLAHGVPREAAAVYNVATPASFVEGNGKYLNSSGDTLLAWVKTLGFTPLPHNIDLVASNTGDLYSGHSFSGEYLANAPERVVGDIKSLVDDLEPAMTSESGECFTAPDSGLIYQAAGAAYTVGDVAARAARQGYVAGKGAAAAAIAAGRKVYADIAAIVGGIKGVSRAADGSVKSRTKNFTLIDKLYGSSLNSEELRELLGEEGGAAIIAAPAVAGAEIEEYDPAAPRRYVSRSSHRSGPEPEFESGEEAPAAEVVVAVEESVVEEVASTTDEVATTSEEISATPVFLGGSPVEDTFDSGTSGWTTFGHNGVLPATTTTECISGACVAGQAQNPSGARMYALGTPKQSGAFSVYVKLRGGSSTPLFNPSPQIHLCLGAGVCEDGKRLVAFEHTVVDNTWYRYVVAWREGVASLELCTLRNSTDMAECVWERKEAWSAGSEVNGIALLSGSGYRLDLGGEFWFDELIGYTP